MYFLHSSFFLHLHRERESFISHKFFQLTLYFLRDNLQIEIDITRKKSLFLNKYHTIENPAGVET